MRSGGPGSCSIGRASSPGSRPERCCMRPSRWPGVAWPRRSVPTSASWSPTGAGSTCPPGRTKARSNRPRPGWRTSSGPSSSACLAGTGWPAGVASGNVRRCPAARCPHPKLTGVTDEPIGIFDSGFGGLTVARAIIDQLPHETLRYLGDTARQPYGPKPIAEVRRFALECLDHLVESGVKLLVIACNSASAAMLRDARERYAPIPVVEVINPAVRRAVKTTRNNRVGVISTRSTKMSLAYEDAFAAAPHVTLVTRACPRFVEYVERGITHGPNLLRVAHEYLDPVVTAEVDTLILGCTHYPLLTGVISYVMGPDVTLVSSAEETAQEVYRQLASSGLLRSDGLPSPDHHFATTGEPLEFKQLAHRFLGPEVGGVAKLSVVASLGLG